MRVLSSAWESCLTSALPTLIYPTLLLFSIKILPSNYIRVLAGAWEFFLTGANLHKPTDFFYVL